MELARHQNARAAEERDGGGGGVGLGGLGSAIGGVTSRGEFGVDDFASKMFLGLKGGKKRRGTVGDGNKSNKDEFVEIPVEKRETERGEDKVKNGSRRKNRH